MKTWMSWLAVLCLVAVTTTADAQSVDMKARVAAM